MPYTHVSEFQIQAPALREEEAEEEAATGLSLRQFEEPQLVGLQILLL